MLIFVKDSGQTLRTWAISSRATLYTQALGCLSRSRLPPLLFSIFLISLLSRPSSRVADTTRSRPAHLTRVLVIGLHQRGQGLVKPHQRASITYKGALVPDPWELHLEAADECLNAEARVD